MIKQFDLFEADFSEEAMNSLKIFEDRINKETGEWYIPEEEIKSRVDLWKWRIWTCDPKTAKDLDDSLSLEHI